MCSVPGSLFREALTNVHPGLSIKGQRASEEQNMRNREGIWSCLSQRKENVGATWMDVFKYQSTFVGRREEGFVFSKTLGLDTHRVTAFFLKDGQGLRSHVAQGVQIFP